MIAVRRLLAVLALAVVVAVLAAAPGGAQTAPTKCTAFAVLKPSNEVPAADSRTTGAALVHINGTRVSFTVVIANPERETFTAGHIHVGAAGVNGGVVVTLFTSTGDNRRLFTQFDSIQVMDPATTAAICGNLAGHYVNYHTTEHPGGALRGQLTRLF